MTRKATRKLDALLADVRRLAEREGAKKDLAEFLKVPLPRVYEWIAGKWLPGGEVTLLMSDWVQTQVAPQQKSPGRARTRPEPKTRMKGNREKSKQTGRR